MYLLNVSSNHRENFFIGTALTQLNELGDMYVSDVFTSPDRAGGSTVFYNCCVQLKTDMALEALITHTKAIETQLGRKQDIKNKNTENKNTESTETSQTQQMPIDIDVLAKLDTAKNWRFLEKRLPLTDDVCWGLADLQIAIPDTLKNQSSQPQIKPPAQGWWD